MAEASPAPAKGEAHPMAGAKGEGPPIAPPNWRWRCGNRVRDMYFYAPDGKQLRSRTELAAFLAKLPNGPSPTEFCWKVTADIVRSGVWKKDEVEARPKNSSASKSAKGSQKRKSSSNPDAADSSRSAETDPKSNVEEGEAQTPEPLAVRAPGTVASKKVSPPSARTRVRAKKNKAASSDAEEVVQPSFKEILQENSSFMWLRNEKTMQMFLQEASKLEETSAENVRELRDVLVARNLQNTNLTKYPNAILRIFARILGVNGLGEKPSDRLGKVELASLCVNLARIPSPSA